MAVAEALKPVKTRAKIERAPIGAIAPVSQVENAQRNFHWQMTAPHGSIPADFHLQAAPFSLVAQRIRRLDQITLQCPQSKWLAGLVVVDQMPLSFALCHLVWAINLPPRRESTESEIPSGFAIIQGGPTDIEPWRVIRLSDGVCINQNQYSHYRKADALAYLLNSASLRDLERVKAEKAARGEA